MISSIKDSVPAKAFFYTFSSKAIVDFHGKFVKTFDALPSDHKVKEVAIRAVVVAVAILAYPILLATALISLAAKAIFRITGITPSPEKVELDRLRKSGILTPEIEKKIDTALNTVASGDSKKQLQMKCELGRALEIKKEYGKDHYVFTHAQATVWMTTTYLIKELVKTYYPEKDLHNFKYLRTPEEGGKDTENYAETKGQSIHDHKLRKDLLSVDAYWYSTSSAESALSFVSYNQSIYSNKEKNAIETVTRNIIKEFLPKELPAKELNSILSNITSKIKTLNNSLPSVKAGNLFVICVPKILVNEMGTLIGYRSHPYGTPCDCHSGDLDESEILQKLQDNILNEDTKCKTGLRDIYRTPIPTTPQYRLMTSALTPDSGVKSFLLTPLIKEQTHKIKDDVKKIVTEVAKKTYEYFQTKK